YKLVEWVVGDRVVLEANPSYWRKAAIAKRIVWKTIPDSQTRVAALLRGEVDAITNLPIPLEDQVKNNASTTIYSELGSFTHKIIFNTREPGPLQDKRVRQALNHAVNKQAILDALYKGHGKLETSIIVQQLGGFAPSQPYAYDPAKAKQLLTEAGFANGFETTLHVPVARYALAEEAVQAIAGDLEKVGVKAKIQPGEWAVYNSTAAAHKLSGMFYYPFSHLLWEPDQIFGYFLEEGQRWNYFISKGQLRENILAQRKEFDATKRAQFQAEVQKELWDEAPWLFLYQIDELFGLNKNVKNFRMAADQVLRVEQAYAEK
ncbi:MAG: ABC transporter substrate-binding protein, partial [Chloroflexi bacterium]|nr:ABC transporter substrate-binding protein [Chloroflexota bacterium]